MNDIRETIAETEKRIKRLGERSQEINGVVEIINNIAERTHVLALNASMQAAAAGDAGRGFAVVADEVQRLAESSRQSTSEIAGLVGNIQAETAETMATMNKTIAQVVEGTELAQAAGGQMESTQKTTAELAHAVEQIAKRSLMQARISNSLRDQAAQVQASTQETSAELKEQSGLTVKLVEYSGRLVDSVAVFKLPEAS
jgi:methyl-accepting chemotaxis protein